MSEEEIPYSGREEIHLRDHDDFIEQQSKIIIALLTQQQQLLVATTKKRCVQTMYEFIPRSMLLDCHRGYGKHNLVPVNPILNPVGFYGRIIFCLLLYPKLFLVTEQRIQNRLVLNEKMYDVFTKNFTAGELGYIGVSTAISKRLYWFFKGYDGHTVLKYGIHHKSSQQSSPGATKVSDQAWWGNE